MAETEVEPYELQEDFERAVVALCCTNPRFWRSVGQHLDPGGLGHPMARLIVKTVKAVALDSKPPDSFLLIVQRLARLVRDGSLHPDKVNEAGAYVDAADDAGIPDPELVRDELVPILRRRAEKAALHQGMGAYSKNTNLEETAASILAASRIGQVTENAVGLRMGPDSFKEISVYQKMTRLSTGIQELDHILGGGMPEACMGMLIGGPGEGKSMGLAQITGAALLQNQFVGVVTTEVSRATWFARLKAGLTGVKIDQILSNGQGTEKARRIIEGMSLGPVWLEYMSAGATTEDIIRWVNEREKTEGRKMDMLVVDYLDMISPRAAAENQYLSIRNTYKDIFDYFSNPDQGGRGMRVWTASQSKDQGQGDKLGKKGGTKIKNEYSGADSLHKVRIVDLAITLNCDETHENIELFTAKYRLGQAKQKVGPLPTSFATARIAPSSWNRGAEWSAPVL